MCRLLFNIQTCFLLFSYYLRIYFGWEKFALGLAVTHLGQDVAHSIKFVSSYTHFQIKVLDTIQQEQTCIQVLTLTPSIRNGSLPFLTTEVMPIVMWF